MESKSREKLIAEAIELAKENIRHIISEDKMGYRYYLNLEIKQILAEQGIDWEPVSEDSPSESVD